MIDTTKLTIKTAREALLRGDFTAVDLAGAYLKNIEAKNGDINAYLEVFADVLEQAKEADKKIAAQKENSPMLAGIPFAIKDNILIKGRRAGSASKILEGYIATYDATAIAKLKAQGAIFLGRTNMDEFAMGGSNENSAYGPVKNPSDTTRISGGSSGGSVAAVAMDGALVALGSDTGGSVRQPASLCGVVGFKPTYGAISRYGLMAMGSSLDQIGAIGKSVADTELIFNALKGNDPMDSTTLPDGSGTIKESSKNSKNKMTIGVPMHLMKEGIDPAVLANYKESIEKFRALGYDIKEISLPNSGYALAVYYVLMPAEASSNLARFDGVKYGLHVDGKNMIDDYFQTRTQGFGKEVQRRIILGNYILSSGYYDAYYNKANALRELIRRDYDEAFKEVDLVLTPTSPIPAWKIGEKSADPLAMYLADIFTVTANLTGMPAISIPSGKTAAATPLPLGVQLTAPHEEESRLFTAGKDFLGETV